MTERTAIVTGAGAGIGEATAVRLAADGFTVALCDIDATALGKTSTRIEAAGGCASAHVFDVADETGLEEAVLAIIARAGSIDVLVNNAGVAVAGGVEDLSLDDWNRVMDVNLRSTWLMMKHVMPAMTAGACVINMSSAQALLGFPGWAGYAATKGAIISLTQQAAVEYGDRGIRVNAVAPGTIMTPLNERIFAQATDPQALIAAWGSQHALGRFGRPEEVAGVVSFLASDDASFVTGVCLSVDGGMRILGPTASSR